jgi:hypothetical protein
MKATQPVFFATRARFFSQAAWNWKYAGVASAYS